MFHVKRRPKSNDILFKNQVREARLFFQLSPRQFATLLETSVENVAKMEWGIVPTDEELIAKVMSLWMQARDAKAD